MTVSGLSRGADRSSDAAWARFAVRTTMLVLVAALATVLWSAAGAGAATPAADRAALRALGSAEGSAPVIVFRATRPLAPGTVIAEAGLRRVGASAAATDTPARRERLGSAGATLGRAPVVLRVGREPAWLYYEDRGPFQLYEHPGRVALVGVRSGDVRVSRTLAWPPLAGGRLPRFLRSAAAYRDPGLRAFARLPQAAGRAAATRAAAPRQSGATAAGADRAASALAAQDACGVTVADMLDNAFDYASVDRTRAAFGGLLAGLERRDRDFVAARYSTRAALSPTAFASRLARRHGCRSVLLFIAGGGVRGGEPTVSLGASAHASGRLEQQDLRASELRALLRANPSVQWQLVVDAPYAGGLVPALRGEPNLQLLLTASEADEPTYACIPGAASLCARTPAQLAFTHRVLSGLDDLLADPATVDRANAAAAGAPQLLGRLLADGYARGTAAAALRPFGVHPQQYTNFGGGGAGRGAAPRAPPPPPGAPQDFLEFPVAQNQSVSTDEDTPLAINLARNPLQELLGTFTVTRAPAHGRLTGSGAHRIYTPDPDYNGPDSFQFVVRFAIFTSSPGTIDITVRGINDAPVVTTSAGTTVYAERDPPVAVDAGLTVSDVDSANLAGATATIGSGYARGQDVLAFRDSGAIRGSWDAATGVLSLTGSASVADYQAALRSITYENTSSDPTGGTRQIGFAVSDGALSSATATRAVAVSAVNDPPIVTIAGGSVAYRENDPALAIDAALTVSDVDSAQLSGATASIASGHAAAEDVLDATPPGTITASYDAPTGTLTLRGNASVADYEAALRSVTYRNTSDAPSTATRTVTVVATDTGGAGSAPVSRDVTVAAVNDVPSAVDDAYRTDEGTALAVAAPGVLGNDSDLDNDPLTVEEVDGSAARVGTAFRTTAGAQLRVNADGSLDYDPNGQFEDLAAGAEVDDSITYSVSDGNGGRATATIRFTITGVNDAPTAADDAYRTDQDSPLTVAAGSGLLANDGDVDRGDVLTVEEVDGSAARVGTAFRTAAGAQLRVNAAGSLDYDPDGAFDGLRAGEEASETVSYRISDGNGGTATATARFTVTGVNDAPTAADDAYATDEDTPLSVNAAAGVLANDRDADGGDVLTVEEVDGSAARVGTAFRTTAGAQLRVNADGSLDYDPDGAFDRLRAGEQATDSVSYSVSDGNGGRATATIRFTISGVNDAPVAADDDYRTDEDTSLTVAAVRGVLANDTDAEGDPLAVDEVDGSAANVGTTFAAASGALVTVNADGSLRYDPNGQFNALRAGEEVRDTVTYRVADGRGGSDVATIAFTLTGVNDPPTAVDDAFATDEDTALTLTAATGPLANDSDPDRGDVLTVDEVDGSAARVGTAFRTTAGAQLRLNADGSLSYDPAGAFDSLRPGDQVRDSVTYRVSDGGANDTATIEFTITGVNDAPNAVDDSFDGVGNTTLVVSDPVPSGEAAKQLTGSVSANDTDPDNAAAELSVRAQRVSSRLGGFATIDADGTFTYVPPTGETGRTDSFDYEITDGSATGVGTISVRLVGRVWYVDNTDAAGGTGRSGDAFDTLAEATGASTAGDTIYVHRGDATNRGMNAGAVLDSGERLLGEATDLVVGADQLFDGAAARRPAIGNGSGAGVTLASGSHVEGLAISAAGGAAIAGGAGVNGSRIADVRLTGSSGGLRLSGTSGTFSVSDTTIDTTGGTGLEASTAGTLALTSAGTISVRASGGRGVDVSGTALSGTLDDVTVTGSSAGGVALQNTTGSIALGGLSLSVSGGTGFLADNVAGLSLPAAATANVSNSGGTAVALRRSASPNATFDAVGGGGGSATGVDVSGNSGGGTTTFSGATTVSSGGATGVRLDANGGHAVAFTGGSLTIATTSGRGLDATGGGTVTVQGAGNTIAATTGTPLRVQSTTIGAGDLTFQSVAANGAANGIVLDQTGSAGGLSVTGTGAGGSGGTIQNVRGADGTTAGVGVYLNQTADVSLTAMHLANNDGHAIRGASVNGFRLDRSTIDGTNGTDVSTDEGAVTLQELTGTSAITSSRISGGVEDNVDVGSSSGTLALTFDGNDLGSNGTAQGGNSMLIEARGTAVHRTTINNSDFRASREDLFQQIVTDTARSELAFTGNRLRNGHTNQVTGGAGLLLNANGTGSDLTYRIADNDVSGTLSHAIMVQKGTGIANVRGRIERNDVGLPGVADSGSREASGIVVEARGQGRHTAVVANNTVRNFSADGIRTVSGEDGVADNGTVEVDLTVTNNLVTEPSAISGAGFRAEVASSRAIVDECVDLQGNTLTNSGVLGTDIRVFHSFAANVFRLPGYAGGALDGAAVRAYFAGRNTVATTFASVPPGGSGYVDAPAGCDQPPA